MAGVTTMGLIGGRDISKYTIADAVWSKMAEISNINFTFEVIAIETLADLCKFYWDFCENPDFIGFNVALPWKRDILKLVDFVDEKSKDYLSVNAVYKKGRIITSSNTDVIGVEKALLAKTSLEHKKVLILGAGGAGLPTSIYLSKKYDCNVHIFDIKEIDNIPSFVTRLKDRSDIKNSVYDIIINATPVGKYYLDEVPTCFSLPLDLNTLQNITHKDSLIQEMNYFPVNTQLIEFAEAGGLIVVSGVDMLVHQAVESLALYTGYKFNEKDSRQLIDFTKKYSINKESELFR